ncbi:hypothetical protein A2V47_00975 [Candidatus Atribacteria bacterium RBG_19FT_COMBO_35_14]|uniref:Uncharacterized protein n=1 Tax=Candidatus Sediminicultor quintus TaxID=1797291 RepID=A0A1F5ACK7_9BACT|nr:MAG: hypothetical protein A2V47_00975 [Candidatus Atribacteria bacterium RBG_19FT_COMBO_35_14]
MKEYLTGSSLYKRFFSLLGLCSALFIVSWFISYYFLPEQILRNKFPVALLAGEDILYGSIAMEFIKIFIINALIAVFLIVLPSFLQISRISLGYCMPIIQSGLYGMFLGTNSFTVPNPADKIYPTISVLTRSGPYEFIAYILIASVCYKIGYYNTTGKWPKKSKLIKIRYNKLINFTKIELLLLSIAAIILAAACYYEAYRIYGIIY